MEQQIKEVASIIFFMSGIFAVGFWRICKHLNVISQSLKGLHEAATSARVSVRN